VKSPFRFRNISPSNRNPVPSDSSFCAAVSKTACRQRRRTEDAISGADKSTPNPEIVTF
jgi:hypothetical protein